MTSGMRRFRVWVAALATLVLVGAVVTMLRHLRQAEAAVRLPVASARRGEFLVIVRTRGEMKARRSVQIYAPNVPNLRIAWMVPAGERMMPGQPMIRFDSSSAQQDLMQKEAALRQAQATLDQAVA
jgi:HlyD family secretion protein